MLAYRRLHEGKAVLWHAPANQQSALYYHFTPSRGGARVQRVTERVAQQVPSLLTMAFIQHSQVQVDAVCT